MICLKSTSLSLILLKPKVRLEMMLEGRLKVMLPGHSLVTLAVAEAARA